MKRSWVTSSINNQLHIYIRNSAKMSIKRDSRNCIFYKESTLKLLTTNLKLLNIIPLSNSYKSLSYRRVNKAQDKKTYGVLFVSRTFKLQRHPL